MAIQIRRAIDSDIPEISRLVAALASYEEALDPRARFDWDLIRDAPKWLKLVLNREHHALWVADHGDGRLYQPGFSRRELPRARANEADARRGVRVVSQCEHRGRDPERAASQLAGRGGMASPGLQRLARRAP